MKAIQFQGRKLTRTKVKNNILNVWFKATEEDKYDWYVEAHTLAVKFAYEYRLSISQAAGIIAALSPMKTWTENKRIAKLFLQGQRQKLHTKLFISKAEVILKANTDDEIISALNGNKITSFYLNIRYPEQSKHVTIDRHALCIGLGVKLADADIPKMTANQYEFFQQTYIWVAGQLGISPLLLQSATWLVWRRG